MASERRKRDTVFPGSNEWADAPRTPSARNGVTDVPASSQLPDAQTRSRGKAPSPEGNHGTIRSKRWVYKSGPSLTNLVTRQTEIKHAVKASEYVSILQESPWNKYRKVFKLQFGDDQYYNTVAQKKDASPDGQFPLALMRNFLEPRDDHQTQLIPRTNHPNSVSLKEIFDIDGVSTASYEFMPLSLSEVAGNPLLEELDLASILGQVLAGLSYLEEKGLEHGRLACSNILIDLDGSVKLCKLVASLFLCITP
jgi:hypothetical protein